MSLAACAAAAPQPKALFPVQGQTLLAQTAGAIYGVGGDGQVWRYLKTDGSFAASAQIEAVHDFVSLSESLYYTQSSENTAGSDLYRLGSAKVVASSVLQGSLRSDAEALYWLSPSGVVRAGEVIAPTIPDVAELALDDTHVYWSDHRIVWRVPKAGGQVERVLNGVAVTQLQASGDRLFFLADGVAYSLPKAGGVPYDLLRGPSRIWALGQVFYTIYDSRYGDEQALWRMSSDGTGRRSLVYDLQTVAQLSLVRDGDVLYWADGTSFWRLDLAR